LCLATLVAAILFIPDTHADQPRRLDWSGVLLSIGAITALVWTIIEAPRVGWLSLQTAVTFALTLILVTGFLVRERRASEPMLPLQLLRGRDLRDGALAISTAFFALLGFIFLATQYLQLVREFAPPLAGVFIVPAALGIGIGSGAAPGLAVKIGARWVIAMGLSILTAGLLTASMLRVDSSGWIFVAAIALIGFGVGFTSAPATAMIVGSIPRPLAGIGSALNDTTRELGGTIGVAVIGSFAATIYRAELARLTGLPESIRESFPGAVASVGEVTGGAKSSTLLAAQTAFVDGLNASSLLSAALVGICALWLANSALRVKRSR
jgi:hypothetical protein